MRRNAQKSTILSHGTLIMPTTSTARPNPYQCSPEISDNFAPMHGPGVGAGAVQGITLSRPRLESLFMQGRKPCLRRHGPSRPSPEREPRSS